MDNDEKYSIITVNADDDEVVVQAGIPSSEGDQAESIAQTEGMTPEAQIGTYEGDTVSDGKETFREEGLDRGEETGSESNNEKGDVESEYHETTQEELESVAPMSTMQKIIIGIAVLGVIVFALYFNFVLR